MVSRVLSERGSNKLTHRDLLPEASRLARRSRCALSDASLGHGHAGGPSPRPHKALSRGRFRQVSAALFAFKVYFCSRTSPGRLEEVRRT